MHWKRCVGGCCCWCRVAATRRWCGSVMRGTSGMWRMALASRDRPAMKKGRASKGGLTVRQGQLKIDLMASGSAESKTGLINSTLSQNKVAHTKRRNRQCLKSGGMGKGRGGPSPLSICLGGARRPPQQVNCRTSALIRRWR